MAATTDLAERLLRTLRASGGIANGGGAVLAFVLLAGVQAGDDIPADRRIELTTVFVSVLVVAMAAAGALLVRYAAPTVRALRGGVPLDGSAWRRLFLLPAWSALVSAGFWCAGAVLFAVHSATRLGNARPEAVALGVILVLAGLTAAATMYLLVDRGLRPLYAAAFTTRTPQTPEGVAVGPRLVLVWFLGSAVPLMITGVLVASPGATGVGQLRRDSLPWVVVGVMTGGILTTGVARSLTVPLSQLRDSMAEVRAGRFGSRIHVDDATEIGLLQAGFNEMTTGLQERERLQDLFGRHVGTGVAQRALERGAELGGELADASILFIDLIGSTSLAARLPPTEVVSLLNDVFRAVVSASEHEGGWVNKFEGDAALCIFGPPAGDAEHATHALRAAGALHSSLVRLAERHPELDAGIGVSSGEVVAGNVGSEQRFEYTVIGDSVNEAARLTELAKATSGRLLASGATVTRADDAEGRHWRHVGSEQLRGRLEPTELWEKSPQG